MAFFNFVSWSLAILSIVTLAWPLNIPLAALAYKIRLGYRPIPLESDSFWFRSGLASLGLAGISLVLLILNYALVEGAELLPDQVQFVLVLAYIPGAVWFLTWAYALEDMMEGLSVFLVYVLLPGFPLFLVGRLAGWWSVLHTQVPWLLITF